ncbi:MAG: hypothetical protein AAF184_14200 [Pseudomonadota bacterium]
MAFESNTPGNGCCQSGCASGTTAVNCPDCGALECLCRPRFFAGQLLSEEDLNRLDYYIRKKHQLHNRNLHGWGVVNGLNVLCDPCGSLKVTQGYALDPCGNDIVLCQDASVDVCALIRACKQAERQEIPCTPFPGADQRGCDDLEEEWILAVRYCEQPSRGITPLRGASPNKSAACGSGCGGATASDASPRGAPNECEATVICEGYQFEVFRKPEDADDDSRGDDDNPFALEFDGAIIERFNCCVQGLVNAIPLPPGEFTLDVIPQNADAWHQWCCRTRAALIDWMSRQPTTNCERLRELQRIVCPAPSPTSDFALAILDVAEQYVYILVDELLNCLCLALLPPAPGASHDSRVPIASVRVRGADCEVLRVCNWTTCRPMVNTWPSMGYWMGLFPIVDMLRRLLDEWCCTGFAVESDDPIGASNDVGGQFDGATGEAAFTDARGGADSARFASTNVRANSRLNPMLDIDRQLGTTLDLLSRGRERIASPLDANALVASISRLRLPTDRGGLSLAERRNLAPSLLMNSVAGPLVQSFSRVTSAGGGGEFTGKVGAGSGRERVAPTAGAAEASTVADLEARIAVLEAALSRTGGNDA